MLSTSLHSGTWLMKKIKSKGQVSWPVALTLKLPVGKLWPVCPTDFKTRYQNKVHVSAIPQCAIHNPPQSTHIKIHCMFLTFTKVLFIIHPINFIAYHRGSQLPSEKQGWRVLAVQRWWKERVVVGEGAVIWPREQHPLKNRGTHPTVEKNVRLTLDTSSVGEILFFHNANIVIGVICWVISQKHKTEWGTEKGIRLGTNAGGLEMWLQTT